ncbi:hypothetical protein SGPA1_50593 [Streptomyces misionensis JCM 4497]
MPASSVTSSVTVSWARSRVARSKPWGVWTARSRARSGVATTGSGAPGSPAGSTSLTVSASGSAGTTAGAPSRTASMTASTVSTGTRGRAASWTRTTPYWGGRAASPSRTDSWRLSPPGTTTKSVLAGPPPGVPPGSACASSRDLTSAEPSGGATTITRETWREAASARTAWMSMGVPFSARSALGAPGPSRTPRPAAGITAATGVFAGARGGCAGAGRDSSDIGSCQVCVLDLVGYGLEECRARRLDRTLSVTLVEPSTRARHTEYRGARFLSGGFPCTARRRRGDETCRSARRQVQCHRAPRHFAVLRAESVR